MKLKTNGAKLVNFVIDFINEDMSRWEFDLDYSGYVIECFPEFEQEHPRLARRFANTIDRTYDNYSHLPDDRFREAISDAMDDFFGNSKTTDFY